MHNMVLEIHQVSKPLPRTFLRLRILRIHRHDGSQEGSVRSLLFQRAGWRSLQAGAGEAGATRTPVRRASCR